jgi:hypothetical protein
MFNHLSVLLLLVTFAFTTHSANAETMGEKVYSVVSVNADVAKSGNAAQICEKPSVSAESQQIEKPDGSFDVANISCGIPPIPPIGCRVGACICDQHGRNCQWTFICN